jgi:hypothetical protein
MDLHKGLQKYQDLYMLATDEGRVLFRLMDHESFKSISYVIRSYPQFKFDLEDQIWTECVLEHTHSKGKDNLPAGLVTTVAQLVLYFSSPKNVGELNLMLNISRQSISDAREQAIITICEAFPAYLPEVLEKMTWPTLLRRLAQAERILDRNLEFLDTTSQKIDDSDRIFEQLDEMSSINTSPVDFSKSNNMLREAEFGTPEGDHNLNRLRGQ